MRFLQKEPIPDVADAVSRYLVHWASLTWAVKMELLHDWKNIGNIIAVANPSANAIRVYRLPTLGLPSETIQHLICRNALCGVLHVGKRLWKTAMKDPLERSNLGSLNIA